MPLAEIVIAFQSLFLCCETDSQLLYWPCEVSSGFFSFSQLPGGKQFPWPWFYCILAWSKNCRGNGLRNCQVTGEFQSLLASFVLPRIIGSNHWTLYEFDIADQSVSIYQSYQWFGKVSAINDNKLHWNYFNHVLNNFWQAKFTQCI